MSFFDLILYDYMPKGSYCVTANGVVFSEEVSEEMKNRFLKDLEKIADLKDAKNPNILLKKV